MTSELKEGHIRLHFYLKDNFFLDIITIQAKFVLFIPVYNNINFLTVYILYLIINILLVFLIYRPNKYVYVYPIKTLFEQYEEKTQSQAF